MNAAPIHAASAHPIPTKSNLALGLVLGIWVLFLSFPALGRVPSRSVRSVSVLKGLVRVRALPRMNAKVVGKIVASGRFPVLEVRASGKGCASRWYRIGPRQWVCSGWIQPHAEPPTRIDDQVARFRQGTWLLNRTRRIPFYPSLRRLGASNPRWLRVLAGFQVRSERFIGRRSFVHTATGGWVALSDTRPAPVSRLVGIDIPEGSRALPFAFVVTESAPIWKEKRGQVKATSEVLSRYAAVRIQTRIEKDHQCFLRLLSGKLLRCEDARLAPLPPPPPEGLAADALWLDIDGRNKILYARKGKAVLRVMLVSLGDATPSGLFLVKDKWLTLTLNMRYGKHPYFLENVPFVIFFWKGFALHEAYWHDGFGVTKSHGCINLSPADARWVFRFVNPALPAGFVWIKTTDPDKASFVRVRGTHRRVRTPWKKYLIRRLKKSGPQQDQTTPATASPPSS